MKDLNWRFEYKYYVPRSSAEALEKVVRGLGFSSDTHSVDGEYPVTSIYFDSPGLYDYYDKSGGFLKRKKIRARIYTPWQDNNSDDFWFEIKWRKNLLTAKDRVRLTHAEWEVVRKGEYNKMVSSAREENREVLSRMAGFLIGGSMQPTVLVHYIRRPLIMNKAEFVRINFDRSITACEKRDFWYTPFMTRVLPEEFVILEMKFTTTIPEWLPDIVRSFGLNRVSYSKYFEALSSVRSLRPLPR
jgi:hypothetical protein